MRQCGMKHFQPACSIPNKPTEWGSIMSREVVVVSGVRTPIGTFGGSLKDFAPTKLGALVVREALQRASVNGDEVGQVVFGNVIQTEPRDMYLSRVAALDAGVTKDAQAILLGDSDIAVSGGAESMSRAPYLALGARWGARMGDSKLLDMMLGALHDPFEGMHMGVTAENVATKYGITRGDQDALALASHQRASAAIRAGHFKSQILPVELQSRKGVTYFDTDEHVRHEVTLADLAKLKPVFQKENGTVTAGNASGLNDGAAAMVLMEAATAKARGIKPLARLVAYGHAGVEPSMMGIGPVPATQNALRKAGLKIGDMDVIEANEAFAAQACAVTRGLEADPAKVNPNGSGISLGHPIGATGAIITIKALYELERIGGRYALVTMCIGGGQGIAAIFERVA
jgi:acetyl-CoA C-acetyltransferase